MTTITITLQLKQPIAKTVAQSLAEGMKRTVRYMAEAHGPEVKVEVTNA